MPTGGGALKRLEPPRHLDPSRPPVALNAHVLSFDIHLMPTPTAFELSPSTCLGVSGLGGRGGVAMTGSYRVRNGRMLARMWWIRASPAGSSAGIRNVSSM